jgi:hypothetical protein
MKKLFALLFCFLGFVYSQSPDISDSSSVLPKSVIGLNFGSDLNTANAVIKSRNKLASYEEIERGIIKYDGPIQFGEYTSELTLLLFTDSNKLGKVVFFIEPNFCSDIFSLYDDILASLKSKYLDPEESLEYYVYPYEKSDRYKYTESMVKNGKVAKLDFWKMNNGLNILVEIGEDCRVKVSYEDSFIWNSYATRIKNKKSNDY